MPHQPLQTNDVSRRLNGIVIANLNADDVSYDDLVQIVTETMMSVFVGVLVGFGRRLAGLGVCTAIQVSSTSTSCWQRDVLLPAHHVDHCTHYGRVVL